MFVFGNLPKTCLTNSAIVGKTCNLLANIKNKLAVGKHNVFLVQSKLWFWFVVWKISKLIVAGGVLNTRESGKR